jgi:hypothetical protein
VNTATVLADAMTDYVLTVGGNRAAGSAFLRSTGRDELFPPERSGISSHAFFTHERQNIFDL